MSTAVQENSQWDIRLESLGLQPGDVNTPTTQTFTTNSIRDYLSWIGPRSFSSNKPSVLAGKDLSSITREQAQAAVDDHLMGSAALTDDDELDAAEAQLQPFSYEATVGTDIVVTADSPLLIYGSVEYNSVTIQQGGYIQFLQSATLNTQTFTKVMDNTSSKFGYDIVILGQAGSPGVNGAPGYTSSEAQAKNGENGKCNACQPTNGRNGHDGENGGPGGDGSTYYDGSDAPNAILNLGLITGTATMVNTGGAGGAGGAGGTGGNGQTGGNGGKRASCCSGSQHSNAGDGGTGGNGGNGGNGGQGGSGGNGGTITVSYQATSTGSLLVTNGVALGGAAGAQGLGGLPGQGGGSGGGGGHQGSAGTAGQPGTIGVPGNPGYPGSTTINNY